MFDPKIKSGGIFRFLCSIQVFVLAVFLTFPSNLYAQSFSVLSLPKPGQIVTTSENFEPLLIKGISLHKENPLVFDFILDPGRTKYSNDQVRTESQRLIKYFFAALTVPEKDLWVNLSPYEKDRMIPEGFGKTEMGRDLLAQDYILKQLSASLIYPEHDLGKDFWSRVYRKAKEVYGSTDIPVNTFNKVWIVPDKVVIVESSTSAYVTQSRLKVMLEEDYVSMNANRASEVLGTSHLAEKDVNKVSNVTSNIVREIVLPEIEKEVNEGKNFAQLRQIYNSVLLATWFKINLKENILNEVYSNQNKVLGVNAKDETDKEKIYQQYLAAFREGVFNYIKEDVDEATNELIPRKYFSGGTNLNATSEINRGKVDQGSGAGQNELSAETARKAQEGEETLIGVTAAGSRTDQFQLRKDALAGYLAVKGDIKFTETQTEKIRQIDFNYPYTLKSVYSRRTNTTVHEFSGYGNIRMVSDPIQGDETGRNWQEIVSLLEDGLNSQGIPYRDGVNLGNSYNQRMSQEAIEEEIASDTNRPSVPFQNTVEFNAAKTYLESVGKSVIDIQDFTVISSNKNVTFGVAVRKYGQKSSIVIEDGFLELVQQKGNPFDMLTRAFVYVLNGGTHEQNRIAEYEYAKSKNPNVSKDLRVDVEQVFENLVSKNLTQETGRDEQLAREWTRKVKESLWEIGVHLMNGDMRQNGLPRVRWSENDAEFKADENTGDVRIGLFASALNPLHFGQFEPVLRAIAQLKIDQIGIANHAFDYRKQNKGLNPTFQERDQMAEEWVKQFGGLLVMAKVLDGSEADGETKFQKLIELNAGRKGTTTFVYTAVGGDHMHIYAPGAKDDSGYRQPKRNDRQEPQDDTVTKIDKMRTEMTDFMIKNKMSIVLAFNFREIFESLPMPIESEALQRYMDSGFIQPLQHVNLFGTSSTNIRDFFAGDKSKNITFLPNQIREYIRVNGRYRGWVVGLPSILKKIASSENPDVNDIQLLRNWVEQEREQGKEPTSEQIAQYFSFTLEQLQSNFRFTAGSLTDAERNYGEKFQKDLIEVTPDQVQNALTKANITPNSQLTIAAAQSPADSVDEGDRGASNKQDVGGIDFNPENIKMEINKENGGIKVEFDPKVLEEIRAKGIEGIVPVILNVQPVTDILPILSQNEKIEKTAQI
ncbi:MAG: hypothetical protein JNN05_07525 [Candidatus Omnitrophica bacterium]|nr:hypothetical protein [Candidatus Omnitrophota bacterium]